MKPDISSGSVRLRGERRIYQVRMDFRLLFRTKPFAEEIALSLDLESSQRSVEKKWMNIFGSFTDYDA